MVSPPTDPHLRADALLVLSCLDLTSLNDADNEAGIARLCARAEGPYGAVAAVCVWPRFVTFARRLLPQHIAVAAVANFPDGQDDMAQALRDTEFIVRSGAQEVDLVLPYRQLMRGDDHAVAQLLQAARQVCMGLTFKVILETGVLADPGLIRRAADLSLDAGADFLKTSTGKTAVSATLPAARTMLRAIADHPLAAARAGLKASGGIRTLAQALTYVALVRDMLGMAAVDAKRLRIGASSLLDDIETALGTNATAR